MKRLTVARCRLSGSEDNVPSMQIGMSQNGGTYCDEVNHLPRECSKPKNDPIRHALTSRDLKRVCQKVRT